MTNTNIAYGISPVFRHDSPRQVADRTHGSGHGPIVRLVSPGDIGQLIKPFVFLDRFSVEPTVETELRAVLDDGYHPHSGITTITTLLSGALFYEDTTGGSGVLDQGGIEYMQAGGGVWHTGSGIGAQVAKGFQLWVALPPELENAKATSTYLPSHEVPNEGPVRVILGSYGSVSSHILKMLPLTYLHVRLKDGERWVYKPPKSHDVAWVAVHNGELRASNLTLGKEIAVFEESTQAIEFIAQGMTDFVLGSAVKHPHDLVLGPYSVHTNSESLKAGWAEIERIGRQVKS